MKGRTLLLEKETLKAVNVPRLRDGICVVQTYIYLNCSIQQVNMLEVSNKTKRPMLTMTMLTSANRNWLNY